MTELEQFLLPCPAIECMAVMFLLMIFIGVLGYVLAVMAAKSELFRLGLGFVVMMLVLTICIMFVLNISAT